MVLAWREFDVAAPRYDEWYETPLGSFVDGLERRAIVELLEPRESELILDVGSGTGRYVRALAGKGARCIGIEPSAGMIEVARSRGDRDNPAYVRAVAEHLPFCSGAFDAVVAITTLEFVGDVDRALAEAARVVKTNGRLVVGALHARGPWARFRQRSTRGVWRMARFFTRPELEERLRCHGEIRSRLLVHVPPQLGALPRPVLAFVDRTLRLLAPSSGAFLAIRVDVRR
jgi:ubiquinone/menaquinone biosynthesis C-methylase UbiE